MMKSSKSLPKKVLVIGGTGFLGKSMKSYFNNKDYEINLIGRMFENFDFENYDIIVHAGASADPKYNRETFIESFESSNETTRKISRKLLNENPTAKYIYISSGCVNFTKNDLINNSYLELKRTGELYTYDLKQKGVNAKIVRLFSVIGPHFDAKSSLAVNTFINKACRGEKINIHPNADNIIRSYLYSDEMSDQILKVHQVDDFILEIGSDDVVSIKEVANIIAHYFNTGIETIETKFYSNTIEKQLPNKVFAKPTLSSKQAIIKTLENFKK